MTSQIISLNGNWRLRWYDGQRGVPVSRLSHNSPDHSRAIEAQVPGAVHLDLMRAGLLKEPAEGLNVLAARWVEEMFWFYHRTLTLPALAPGERAFLTFEALDLVAVITLNGREVGRHANAFYPCRIDVTDAVQPGENNLVVSLDAGLYQVSDRSARGYGMSADSLLHKRNWLRQVQSSFGWDWSPRLLNVGLRGSVSLEICSQVRLDQCVVLAALSDDLQTGTITVRWFVDGLGQMHPGRLALRVEETGQALSVPVDIFPGLHPLHAQVTVPHPRLWWPVNHGEQARYHVSITLSIDEVEVGQCVKQVGFRKVDINQVVHPESGRYFIVEINHKPIFCKGANLVPADLILARNDADRYTRLVERALESNINMLRIWGGGLYESDRLFDLCDEKGLLTWQEFIFACAKYPLQDEAFLEDVKREAAYQVRRLAHHPSLVVWCGNNELEVAAHEWHYDRGVVYPDYALFHLVLPILVREEDGTRFYQPSSPYSPDHLPPNQEDIGDQHPWSLGFINTDFRGYRDMICRFPNEGGTLGPTSLPTMLACLPGAAPDSCPFSAAESPRLSFAWETHDNAIAATMGDKVYPDLMLEQWLGRRVETMTVADFVYYGGLLQGQGLTEYIRNFRRRMFDSASAIFWMFNDCWPAVRSWTIVDYYGRRTPSFYPVRRAFAPHIVAVAVEADTVKIFGVNEGPEWSGELHCGLFALAGGYPLDMRLSVTLPANTSTQLAGFALDEWLNLGVTTHAAFARLLHAGEEIARDVFILPFYKEMVWPEVSVSVRRVNGKAIFESDRFAFRVCLDLDGDHSLPDNFFDLLPGIPTILDWPEQAGDPVVLRVGNLSL